MWVVRWPGLIIIVGVPCKLLNNEVSGKFQEGGLWVVLSDRIWDEGGG